MRRKIIYLINPIAGTRSKTYLRELIQRKTAAQGIPFELLPTRQDGSYADLVEKIRVDSITDLVVCGGDGTVNAVIAATLGTAVNIGIIPAGSGNGLAFAAGIPVQPSRALAVIFRGNARPTDAFYINDRFSCMLCGIGLDASVAHAFAKQKTRGLPSYAWLTAAELFKAKPYSFYLETREASVAKEAFFICIANGNQFGNHVMIAPHANLHDGLLDIVVVKKMNKVTLPFSLISQAAGWHGRPHPLGQSLYRHIDYFQTDQLTLRNPQLAPLHIDGEPAPSQELFLIRTLPGCFRLLKP
jgi:diacylglycerol kinase (ATP)